MKGKLMFVLGAAVGYILGSRAGQEHYDKIKEQAKNVWENPTVQEKVSAAETKIGDVIKEQGSNVAGKVTETVKNKLSSAESGDDEMRPTEPYPPAPPPSSN